MIKKFAFKILVFVVLVVIIVIIINFIYLKMDNSNSDSIQKFSDVPQDIIICNFGSSHGLYGFNYNDFSCLSCFNFALSSQYFSYDLRLFNYYKTNIKKGAVVFIPVSYFLFFSDVEVLEESFLAKNRRYYKILPEDFVKQFNIKEKIIVEYFPSLLARQKIFSVLLGRSLEDLDDKVWTTSNANNIDVNKDANAAFIRHIKSARKDEFGNRIVNEEEVESLKELIKSCYENGFIPVLLTTPFTHEYTDVIKEKESSFFDDFYGIIDEIKKDTGVQYYDYAFDSRFINNHSLFRDSDHLNKEGARLFVDIIMDEIVHFNTPFSLIKD